MAAQFGYDRYGFEGYLGYVELDYHASDSRFAFRRWRWREWCVAMLNWRSIRPLLGIGTAIVVAIAVVILGPWILRESRQTALQVMIYDWPGDQVFAWADEMEFDREHGIDMEVIRVPRMDDQMAAWRTHGIDVQVNTISSLFSFAEVDEVRIIYAYDDSFGGDGMLAVDSIRSLEDLRGQRIGVRFGGTTHFLTLHILARSGIRVDEVTLIDVHSDEIAEALRRGQITVATTWEPNLSNIVERVEGLHVLATTRDFPNVIVNVLMVRKSALDADRDRFVNLLRAVDAATRRCQADMMPCLKILAETTGRSIERWRSDFRGLRLFDLDDNFKMLEGGSNSQLTERLHETYIFLSENRKDMPKFDVSRWIDTSIVTDALRE